MIIEDTEVVYIMRVHIVRDTQCLDLLNITLILSIKHDNAIKQNDTQLSNCLKRNISNVSLKGRNVLRMSKPCHDSLRLFTLFDCGKWIEVLYNVQYSE